MAAWSAISWVEAGQILEFIGDAVDVAPYREDLRKAPEQFFQTLLDRQNLHVAIFFMGHALPRYEGVVWAARSLLDAGVIDRSHPLTHSILRWIDEPSDELRRGIKALVDKEQGFTPVRMLGLAVFVSGGSISEPDLPPVLAPADASPKLVSGAILAAAYAAAVPDDVMRVATGIGQEMASQGAVA